MRKKIVEEHQDHIIELESYDMHYMFCLNHSKHENDTTPYEEFCHPRLTGTLIHSPIKDTNKITVTIFAYRTADSILTEGKNPYRSQLLGVGHIEKRKADLYANLSIPLTGITLLNQHLIENRIPYLALHAKKLRYGKGSIVSYHFMPEYELEDYI